MLIMAVFFIVGCSNGQSSEDETDANAKKENNACP
jgi:hypothetical protein